VDGVTYQDLLEELIKEELARPALADDDVTAERFREALAKQGRKISLDTAHRRLSAKGLVKVECVRADGGIVLAYRKPPE
jgi:hypothetical protein